jgi:ribosomal protein S18 acetylase RimI-like enzyme
MKTLRIRHAGLNDLKLIAALGITTCYEAYFELDPSTDLAEYCVTFFSLEMVKAELEDPRSTYLIAELDGNAVGFAKLREGKKIDCLDGRNAIEVQRIYLLEKVKGAGVGRALIEKCREIGRAKGYETLWLGVWDQNIEAQKFYERIGMKNVGLCDFSDGKNKFINFVFAEDL